MLKSKEPEFSTLVDVLTHRAMYEPEKVGFTFLHSEATRNLSLTYRELDHQARVIAATLQAANLAGERAVLLYQPGLEFVAAYFGCLYAAVIPVPAYPPRRNQKNARLLAIASDCRPAIVLTVTTALSNITAHLSENPETAGLRVVATDAMDDALESEWYNPAINRGTLAFLQYTSGSTSAPKGVMVSHGNLLHNSECIRQSMELDEESVSVTWLPSYHDMGMIDGIIQPLYTGFPAFLMSPATFLQEPIRWLQAISDCRATHSGGPNFAYGICVKKTTPQQRDKLDLSSWLTAYNGAEPIRHLTLKEFAAEFEPFGFRSQFLYPCYGLAEATLMVTGGLPGEDPLYCNLQTHLLEQHRVVEASPGQDARVVVGCGRVHLGTRVVIVDPETQRLCAPDRIGEIWVSGPSVASGYWGQIDKTEETFRAYTADTHEGPFLRTGDLGFIRNGELFLTGRLKDLLIVRGRNHYPQDIEQTVEQSHPALRTGCGAAFTVNAGDSEHLVVVQEVERSYVRKLNVDEIARAIRRAVAEEHELQAYAVVLLKPGKIPKTSSGKIQRQTCSVAFVAGELDEIGRSILDLDDKLSVSMVPTCEEILALPREARLHRLLDYFLQTVSEVIRLPLSKRNLQDSLMHLGMDSLMAIELNYRVQSELAVTMSQADILQTGSLRELAGKVLTLVEGCQGVGLGRSEPASVLSQPVTEYPLSRGQEALWFLHEMAPESAAYNVAFAVRIVSDLDVDVLEGAFSVLNDRHPSLRTTFTTIAGRPAQRAREESALEFEVADAWNWSSDDVDQCLLELSHRPFDLQAGPLFRVCLCRRSVNEHILLVTAHHIVVDLWSLVVLLDELSIAYAAMKAGQPVKLPQLESQPADFVKWQAQRLAGPLGEELAQYWENRLAGAPTTSSLPSDRPRPPVQTFEGAVHVSRWDDELVENARERARSQDVTIYMLLLTAFQLLLHRYTGQYDILVGSSVAGRNLPEFSGTVGYFVNQVVLRADLSGNPTFDDVLSRVKQTVLGALAHQEYPFPALVERLHPERDASRSPLFQTMFVLEKPHRLRELASLAAGNCGSSVELRGLQLESVALERRAAQFDLTLTLVDGDPFTASWEHNTNLFDPVTILRMAENFKTLIQSIIQKTDRPLDQLTLLRDVEQHQMLMEWNDTRAAYAEDKCMHELFQAQVEATPDAIALVYGNQYVGYQELNRRANQVARHLERLHFGAEVLAGVCMQRSLEMVVAMLGVLKAGGAYVPLDPSYPRDRLAYMLQDANAAVLLSQDHLLSELSGSTAKVVCLDSDWQDIALNDCRNPFSLVSPDNIAYVIYTSGSTGKPKGTMVTHRGLVNYLSWCVEEYAVAGGRGAPVISSIAFDATITGLFSPLLVGRKVVLVPEQDEIAALSRVLLSEDGFSLVKITPAHLDLLGSYLEEQGQIRAGALILGGEALSAASLRVWQARGLSARIINEYGPTETVVGSSVHEVTNSNGLSPVVPIGRPIANTEIYAVDGYLRCAPVGGVAELHIGGVGLARGYYGRSDLTAERFIPNPFSSESGGRLYKTGDMARHLCDGTLEFLGRVDDQVKIRGFRVELGEIEAELSGHPEVRHSAVKVWNDEGGRRLVAYVVPRESTKAPTSGELRRFLADRVPQHMVPSVFVSLNDLPLTSNRKVDRRSLPAPDNIRPKLETAYASPVTEVEGIVASVWREVLQLDAVGIHDNFFELGGHSLLAAQARNKLRERLKQDLSIIEVLQYPTISSFAKHLEPDVNGHTEFQSIRGRARKRRQAALKMKRLMKMKKLKDVPSGPHPG